MPDVVLGGLISLVTSLVTTTTVAWIAYSRERRTRWDKDTLSTVSRSLVSAERAVGRIYAWAHGEAEATTPGHRPPSVEDTLDRAYYELQELSVLFPRIAHRVDAARNDLVALADLTAAASSTGVPAYSNPEDAARATELRARIAEAKDAMRVAAQRRLAIE